MQKKLFALLLLFLIVLPIEGKKKKKNPADKKPKYIEQERYCSACLALVQETLKKINNSKKESDIIVALEGICARKNLLNYEFNPLDLQEACLAFYDGWSDEIINQFQKRLDNSLISNSLCYKKTKACENVDLEKIRKEKEEKKSEYEIDRETGQIVEKLQVQANVETGNNLEKKYLNEEDL